MSMSLETSNAMSSKHHQRELVDLSLTIEKYQEINKRICMDMKTLMQKQKENNDKMAKAVTKLFELSGRDTFQNNVKVLNLTENEHKNEKVNDSAPPNYSIGITSSISNFFMYVLAGMVSFLMRNTRFNRVLKLYGFMLKPTIDKTRVVDSEALEYLKRWKPDDEEETGDEDIEDENVAQNLLVKWNGALSNNSYWNKEPIINFVNDKVFGVKTINDSEELIRNLTPKKVQTKVEVEKADILDDYEFKTRIKPSDSFEELFMDNRLKIEPSESFGEVHDLTGFSNRTNEASTPFMMDLAPGLFVFHGGKDKAAVLNSDLDRVEEETTLKKKILL